MAKSPESASAARAKVWAETVAPLLGVAAPKTAKAAKTASPADPAVVGVSEHLDAGRWKDVCAREHVKEVVLLKALADWQAAAAKPDVKARLAALDAVEADAKRLRSDGLTAGR